MLLNCLSTLLPCDVLRCTQDTATPAGTTVSQALSITCRVLKIAAKGPVKTFCHHRLGLQEQKFNLHITLNADKEFLAQKSAPHRDFYNVRKVRSGGPRQYVRYSWGRYGTVSYGMAAASGTLWRLPHLPQAAMGCLDPV